MCELLSPDRQGQQGQAAKKVISAQVKKGLAKAFRKFSAYNLGSGTGTTKSKLRDVLFLSHPKPKDTEQAATWKALVDETLETPDTWEVALSAGADKKATWGAPESGENRLGYMALLMNLRNMESAKVDHSNRGDGPCRRCAGISGSALPFRLCGEGGPRPMPRPFPMP